MPIPGMADAENKVEQVQTPQPSVEGEVKSSDAEDYKAKFHGLQGNFKQLHSQYEQTARELAELRAERERREAEDRERREAEEEDRALQEMEALLDQPPDEVTERLRAKLNEQKVAKNLRRSEIKKQREVIPQVQKQVADNVHKFYLEGVRTYAEQMGIPPEELQASLDESEGKFDQFLVKLGKRTLDREVKKVGSVDKDELRNSLKQELLAELRGDKKSPDTGGDQGGRTYNSFDELEVGFNNGEVSFEEYRKARKEHGLR